MAKKPPKLSATFSIQDMPETLASMRNELAQMLRDAADDEAPAVAARLREIAAIFETGLHED